MKLIRLLYFSYFFIAILLVGAGITTYYSLQALFREQYWVKHTHQVINSAERLVSLMKDMETGQRGYLLTSSERFLEPYYTANDSVGPALNRLRLLTRDNPLQQQHLDSLTQKISRKISVVKALIQLKEVGLPISSQRMQTELEQSKQVMDSIRVQMDQIIAEENRLLIERTDSLRSRARYTTYTVFLLIALAVASTIFSFGYLKEQIKIRIDYSDRLKELNEELATINEELVATNEEYLAANEQLVAAKDTVEQLSEEAIQASEGRYKQLAESITDPFFVYDSELRFVYWNRAMEVFTGVEAGSALGKKGEEVLRQAYFTESAEVLDMYKHVMETRQGATMVYEMEHRNELKYLDIAAYPVPSGDIFVIIRDATNRLEAERKYRELAESLTDVLFALDLDFRYVYWNKTSEQITGIKAEEALGKTLYELFPHYRGSRIESYFKEVLVTKQPIIYQDEFDVQGSLQYYEVNINPTQQGLTVLSRNITERFEAEARYRELAESITDPFFALNHDWQIIHWNAACESLTKLPAARVVGRKFYTLHPKFKDGTFEKTFLKALETGEPQEATDLLKINGQDYWFETDIYPTRQGLAVYSRDITDRVAAEAKIQHLNETLEQKVQERTDELNVAYREMEAFSYSVSHDLRAPLRTINGFARILEDEYAQQLDAEGRRLLTRIINGAKKMGVLIDDLLTFSRFSRQAITPVRVDMEKLVKEFVNEALPGGPPATLQLVVEDLPEAYGDRNLLKQVWVNLITNALKFSAHNPAPQVKVGSLLHKDQVAYFVQDNGAGFDMQYANKLFKVFQRLHKDTEFEGTGVGLAIVQRIVQRHGGKIWAEGQVNKGATFYFTLSLTSNTELT